MRHVVLVAMMLLHFSLAYSQTGDYYTSHFYPKEETDPTSNYDLEQLPDGRIAIANRTGLLIFDGQNWEQFKTSGTPLSLTIDKDGIFTGGAFGIGYHPFKDLDRVKIITGDSIKDILQVELIEDKIIAISDKKAFIYNASNYDKLTEISFSTGYLKKLLIIQNQPLVSTSEGNFWLLENKFQYADDLPQEVLNFSLEIEKTPFIGNSNGQLYSYNDDRWEEVLIQDKDENFSGSTIIDAILVEGKLVFQTLNSGLLIIDPNSWKFERIINQHHGLPDNELYFISSDKKGGIWTAHQYGLSRVSLNLPLEALHNFPGLDGNPLCVAQLEGQLYVGTSHGLYKLEEVKDYTEVIDYVKKVQTYQEDVTESKGSKGGLFSFLKRKRSEEKTTTERKEVTYQKKVTRELKSIRYLYKKVNDINSKVVQLLAGNNELFAATLGGVFHIDKKNANRIFDEPVRLLWLNRNKNLLIANGYSGHILAAAKKGEWTQKEYFTGFQDMLFDIYEDSKSRIWFASVNEVYFINYDQNDIYAGEEFHLENPYMDPVFITETEKSNTINFISHNGSWAFNDGGEKLEESSLLPVQQFIRNKELWVKMGNSWSLYNSKNDNVWLKAFEEVTYLTIDEDKENFYVIADNQLFKIPAHHENNESGLKHPLLLKAITDNGEKLDLNTPLSFTQHQSNLNFQFVQPEYTPLVKVEYAYRIAGVTEVWSDWSEENNNIVLSYLPEGNYQLEVKSRTSLGDEVSATPVFFNVKPPYWKRPWFYAFEFCVMMMLLLLTIYLNRNAQRYRILNKLIAFLTLIIIIEFIQTSAESNFETNMSPIIGFLIQVIIAFTVLPVEGFLRKLIMQEKKLKIPIFGKPRKNN